MVKKKKKDDSGLSKNHQVLIVIAIIGAIGAFASGPAFNSMWEDRAIIEISFGNEENYPLKELQFDGTNYYVDLVGLNRGESQTFVFITIVANGATVSFNQLDWNSQINQNFLFRPDENPNLYRFYVKPENHSRFTLQVLVPSSKPLINEIFWIFPLNLQFDFSDGKYILTRSY